MYRQRALLAIVIAAIALPSLATTYWVSPSGSDANAGTREAPFATLERAAGAIGASGDPEFVVYVADGTYRLERPLVFKPNGPVVEIRAAAGAKPVISGAVKIGGWTQIDKVRNIWRADAGKYVSRQLYVNGKRAVRARTDLPNGNIPAGFLPAPVLPAPNDQPYVIRGGIDYLTTPLNPEAWRDPATWHNRRDVEAVIRTQWKMMRVPVDDIIAPAGGKPGVILMRQPAWTNANLFFSTKPNSCDPDKPGIWSFWQVTEFENALEFLDRPGEWYLDRAQHFLYYMPRRGEDMTTADVELPVRETLVEGIGAPGARVGNLTFEGLTFAYATWLGPDDADGYVADQSGQLVTGDTHVPNVIGHVREVVRTPGNLRFAYAHDITFRNDQFLHLGAVALDFGPGSQDNEIDRNTFSDISSSAIQLGGVAPEDARPNPPSRATTRNAITNNLIVQTGRDYTDTAAIFAGFTSHTEIRHNTISNVPWAGIAIGWGWGLIDQGMFPGVPCATRAMWGSFDTATINSRNVIANNRISHFIEDRWDGGAIYTTGQQGTSADDPLVIEGNVADNKAPASGGNTFYTDGGSRYLLLDSNVSFSNPIGRVNLGPLPQASAPLKYPPLALANILPYGGDSGGCRTYGDIHYTNNYWMEGSIPSEELALGLLSLLVSDLFKAKTPFDPYSAHGFFAPCPVAIDGVSYPTNLTYDNNHDIAGEWEVPKPIIDAAGVQR